MEARRMLGFLKTVKSVEGRARMHFCDDAASRQTTVLVGVNYGDEAVLNGLDNAHAGIRPGAVSIGKSRIRVVGARREHDLDKKHASYSITTGLLSEGEKAALRGLVR